MKKRFKKKEKKENTINWLYKENYNFLKEIKWYFVFTLGLFCLMFIIGFLFPEVFEEQIRKFIENLRNIVEGKGTIDLITYIFFNNLRASFFALILGITLGIFPLIVIITNGYLVGFVSRIVSMEAGLFVLWRLLPHGIFELPAVFLSTAIGLKVGHDLIRDLSNQRSVLENLKKNYIKGLIFFFSVILPLLIIAAIIEGLLIGLRV